MVPTTTTPSPWVLLRSCARLDILPLESMAFVRWHGGGWGGRVQFSGVMMRSILGGGVGGLHHPDPFALIHGCGSTLEVGLLKCNFPSGFLIALVGERPPKWGWVSEMVILLVGLVGCKLGYGSPPHTSRSTHVFPRCQSKMGNAGAILLGRFGFKSLLPIFEHSSKGAYRRGGNQPSALRDINPRCLSVMGSKTSPQKHLPTSLVRGNTAIDLGCPCKSV